MLDSFEKVTRWGVALGKRKPGPERPFPGLPARRCRGRCVGRSFRGCLVPLHSGPGLPAGWLCRVRGIPTWPVHGRHATLGGNGSSDPEVGRCRPCRSRPLDRSALEEVVRHWPRWRMHEGGTWLSPERRLDDLRRLRLVRPGTGQPCARRLWDSSFSSTRSAFQPPLQTFPGSRIKTPEVSLGASASPRQRCC